MDGKKTTFAPKRAIKAALCFGVIILIALSTGTRVEAISVGFQNITNNNAVDAAIGESQLFVDINPFVDNNDLILFQFGNTGPNASSITDIYFDDNDLLLSIVDILDDDPGVAFSENAAPPDLPGGNSITPKFIVTAGLSADSDPPAQPNGVNPGESLGLLFDFKPNKNFSNLIADLTSGDLRIGIHVQGFATGGSESFINTPPGGGGGGGPVPEPATMLGAFMAFGALTGYVRKRRGA
ncbi:MAG: PEP-CTERM sorting domain-containing protein [Sedimentisphaerales bacterium]|nr:PEP-CTERM sorting domain-containing protein [Sedimentisphaerales bacterium]